MSLSFDKKNNIYINQKGLIKIKSFEESTNSNEVIINKEESDNQNIIIKPNELIGQNETRADLAQKLFLEGYNCCQSVFAAFADIYGIDKQTALRISASFGAGMGRMREICGTVSGMCIVAGLETGATEGKDIAGKQRNYETVQKLVRKFKEKNGSIFCRELLGLGKDGKVVDTTITKPEERTEEYYKKRPCKELIKMAAQMLIEEFNL